MKKSFITFVILCLSLGLYAQDIHNSQFFNAPLEMSPALTGVFNGNQRITANYKNQWASIPVGYSTFIGAYDQAVTSKSNRKGFFSVGGMLNYDKAGEVDLQFVNLGVTGSYSYKLNRNSMITPGIAFNLNSRSYDASKVRSANQWNGDRYDDDIPAESFVDDGITFLDVSLGLNYHLQKNSRHYLDIGAGAFHLLAPNQSFNDSQLLSGLSRRFSLYTMGSYRLTPTLDLLGNVVYSNQNPHSEILLNGQGKIYLNKTAGKRIAIYLGMGMRLGDALYPMVAVEYQNIYAGFNYDINISDLDAASKGRGGPELSFRYLFYKILRAPFKPCPIY